jgi:hypothetical protein
VVIYVCDLSIQILELKVQKERKNHILKRKYLFTKSFVYESTELLNGFPQDTHFQKAYVSPLMAIFFDINSFPKNRF